MFGGSGAAAVPAVTPEGNAEGQAASLGPPTPATASTSADAHELVESFQSPEAGMQPGPGKPGQGGEGLIVPSPSEPESFRPLPGPERAAGAAAAEPAGLGGPVAAPAAEAPPSAAPPPPPRPVGAGQAACRSCGAPIRWVATSGGRRMPINAREIRASRSGPGREVALVVGSEVVAGLREDPDGDVVGHESHFATCPHAERHRQAGRKGYAHEAPTARGSERGGRLRDRRVGLGFHADDIARALLGPIREKRDGRHIDEAIALLDIEDGRRAPPVSWELLESRMVEALELRVSRELAGGKRWSEIRLHGWSREEIRLAAEACSVGVRDGT